MQIGAVPLKEYYSAEKKNHFYKVWNDPDKEKDYVFQRNIGYVYYGRPNPWKQADVITAKINGYPCTITYNLKVKDGNNRYRNLSYSETFDSGSSYIKNESSSITLPNSYVIVSMDIIVKLTKSDTRIFTFMDIEDPHNVDCWIDGKPRWGKELGNTSVFITQKNINNNHITYEFDMTSTVGNVQI